MYRANEEKQNSSNIWATFVLKIVIKNVQKLFHLVTLTIMIF